MRTPSMGAPWALVLLGCASPSAFETRTTPTLRELATSAPTEAPMPALGLSPDRARSLSLVRTFLAAIESRSSESTAFLAPDARLIAQSGARTRPLLGALLEQTASGQKSNELVAFQLGEPQLALEPEERATSAGANARVLVARVAVGPGEDRTVGAGRFWLVVVRQTARGLGISELHTEDGSLR